jgi:integrase
MSAGSFAARSEPTRTLRRSPAVDVGKDRERGEASVLRPGAADAAKAHAHSPLDAAIYTLAAEAGPRLSEISAVKVRNVDFANGILRFEDGYTRRGGHAGTKGRRVRSVPMSANVRAVLLPYCRARPRRGARV